MKDAGDLEQNVRLGQVPAERKRERLGLENEGRANGGGGAAGARGGHLCPTFFYSPTVTVSVARFPGV